MQKQYLLIPLGIVLFVIGMYISNVSLDNIDSSSLSETELHGKVMSTDYPIGIGLTALGATCILVIFVLKAKSSKQKNR